MADATRREIAALLLSVFLIMFGGGFLSTFVSLRLSAAGVPSALIGAVGTAFFGALSLGSRRITPVIRRVGHIRAFATFASIFSISTLVYGVYIATVPWIALRCVDGAMMSGVLICIESWLNERATLANRGWLLAIYVALTYAGEGLGQMLLLTGSQDRFLPFVVASIALSLAIVPVALIPGSGPLPADHPHVRLRRLIRLSPLGVLGTGGNGLVMGAFYALTAVYLHAIGLSHFRVALFMAVVILGGSLIQWFVGYMSDRCDRREVIIWTSFAAALLAVVLPLVHHEASAFYLLAAGFGGAVFALYPLCVAHTNDRLSSEERVGASSALVFCYSLGAAIGPVLAGGAMTLFGPAVLFAFFAICSTIVGIFGLWRQRRRDAVPASEQGPYQNMPHATVMPERMGVGSGRDDDGSHSATTPPDGAYCETAERCPCAARQPD